MRDMQCEKIEKKATLVISIENEEGKRIERITTGSNEEIAFILGEYGILGEDGHKLLNNN